MSDKEIHGVVKADFDGIKNVSGEEIKGTTKIYVDVPIVPRWLSDILTKFKSESVNYNQFKEKCDYSIVRYVDLEQIDWITDHKNNVDLAVALGAWVVEYEGE